MAARNKPYDQFGPYILFKKLETDSLGELWRAGRVDGGQLAGTVALRRLSGGNRAEIARNAQAVSELLPQLSGHSFARDQVVGVIDGVPYVAYNYAGGRSLRHIVDRARGGNGVPPNPLPMDQAIVIAEKITLSLATIAELRDGSGTRLSHGALIPQFIWITDDGEIRVAGQQLGAGLMASLGDQKVSGDIARYFAPETRNGATIKNADVYSMGAILFLLVTGQEPPDAATASAFGAAVRAAKTMSGTPVPDDIRVILDKSFNLDPSMRYASMGDMKKALSALAHGGKYSATTFNLAFYLSNLLKKEMEGEAVDREKEAKVNVAPYLETPKAQSGPVPAVRHVDNHVDHPVDNAPMFTAIERPKKSKAPLAIAAVVVLGLLAAGAWMMLKPKADAPKTKVAAAATVPAPVKPLVISEPVVASATPQTGTAPATATMTDAEAQKRAFEDAVKLKMQAEMMKLQTQFLDELKQKQPKNAPAAAPAVIPAQVVASNDDDRGNSLSAAQLDQQRRETAAPSTPAPTPAQTQAVTQTQAPAPAIQQPQVTAPAPVQTGVREGDVVDVGSLDSIPKPLRPIAPVYPAIARQQRIAATIILTAFISETGQVTDVRVLRGDPRFGLNDAAVRAMRATRFSVPQKEGKRVKTWLPQTIEFRP